MLSWKLKSKFNSTVLPWLGTIQATLFKPPICTYTNSFIHVMFYMLAGIKSAYSLLDSGLVLRLLFVTVIYLQFISMLLCQKYHMTLLFITAHCLLQLLWVLKACPWLSPFFNSSNSTIFSAVCHLQPTFHLPYQ